MAAVPTPVRVPRTARPHAPPAPRVTLTPLQQAALSRFIQAVYAQRGCGKWRAVFCQCVIQRHFRPYVHSADARALFEAVNEHGIGFVCYLRSAHVLARARQPDADPRSETHVRKATHRGASCPARKRAHSSPVRPG
jgi:hypothetical protein